MNGKNKNHFSISIKLFIAIACMILIFFRCAKSTETFEPIIDIPLLQASAQGNVDQVKKILHAGSSVNVVDQEGNSALMFAVWNGIYPANQQVIELLLEHQADTRCRNKGGICVAQNVIKIDDQELRMRILGKLIKYGAAIADIDNKGFDVLQKDLETFSTSTTGMMIRWWGKLMSDSVIRRAIERSKEYNLRDVTDSILSERKKCVINTKDPYWNPNAIDRKTGMNDLHYAIINNDVKLVEKAVEKKANINKQSADEYEMSPLHYAVVHAHADMVNYLLGKGADVNKTNNSYNRPLHMIAWLADKQAAKKIATVLIENGANINAQNKDGDTLMHMLINNGNVIMIHHLQNSGADINLKIQNNERESVYSLAKRLDRAGMLNRY